MEACKHIGFLFLLLIAISCKTNNSEVVAWVNNHAITKSELKHWMLLEKANVFNYFHRKYGVNDSDNFWTQKLDNEFPLERLRKTALDKAKVHKTQQLLALEKGNIKTANFDDILAELDAINAERKLKVKNGEPIYGPIQFTSRTYYFHVFDKMVIELKNELAKNELKPSHEELNRMKDNHSNATKDISGFLTMQYVDNNYDNYIQQLNSKSNLKINTKVFERINLD